MIESQYVKCDYATALIPGLCTRDVTNHNAMQPATTGTVNEGKGGAGRRFAPD